MPMPEGLGWSHEGLRTGAVRSEGVSGAPASAWGVIRERVEEAEFAAPSQEVQGCAPSSGHSALLGPGLRCPGHGGGAGAADR